uniref:ATP synthase complex subunit 8 n=1 Tax=Geotomus sp. FS-2019 TaxID=2575688 RepID=A0A4D6X0N6_9HEMI|nr:ATP synthase F0 subunit 8 [Geotomus sp. FS-2019]
MPQMAPLWWTTLFMMFILSFMTMNMIIFHLPCMQKGESDATIKTLNSLNWKW